RIGAAADDMSRSATDLCDRRCGHNGVERTARLSRADLSLQPHSARKVRRPFMNVQRLRRVLTVTLTVCGAVAMASPRVQAQDVLPTEGGMITLVGCFLPGGSHHSKYVLAKPIIGSVASVTDGTCSAPIDETAVELKDIGGKHHGEGMLNHLIEVTGR